jgi:hypothetical protein
VVASLSLTWVTTRAAGYTAFALLTVSIALGLLLSSPLRSARWPRFATTELHRFVTLLTLIFIAIHVLVALVDRYIGFSLSEVLVPFTSHYHPMWMGLGILSAYLAAALWATSWLQRRIGYRWWRRLHYATFGVYVGAALHGIGIGSDTGWAWGRAIYVASFALVAGLLVVRLGAGDTRTQPASRRTSAGANLPTPPVTPAAGDLAGPGAVAGPAATTAGVAKDPGLGAGSGFSARMQGRLWQGSDGNGGAILQLEGALYAGFDGDFQLRIHGWMPAGSSQLRITDNRIWLRHRDGDVWSGRIGVFDGMRLRGQIARQAPDSRPLALEIDLFGFAGQAVGGALRAVPASAPTDPSTSSLVG